MVGRNTILVPGLASARQRAGHTRAELAEMAGVDASTVERGEKGRRISFKKAEDIAAALGLSVQVLQASSKILARRAVVEAATSSLLALQEEMLCVFDGELPGSPPMDFEPWRTQAQSEEARCLAVFEAARSEAVSAGDAMMADALSVFVGAWTAAGRRYTGEDLLFRERAEAARGLLRIVRALVATGGLGQP